ADAGASQSAGRRPPDLAPVIRYGRNRHGSAPLSALRRDIRMTGKVITDNWCQVRAVLPALERALAAGTRAVLQAPPGAGKTTCVPPALLSAPWLNGARIIMLEPRRLAARAAAAFMARARGER